MDNGQLSIVWTINCPSWTIVHKVWTVVHSRCDPGFAGRTLAGRAGPLCRESTFRAAPVDRVREQALLDKRGARDRAAIRLYLALFFVTLIGLVCAVLWYFGTLDQFGPFGTI